MMSTSDPPLLVVTTVGVVEALSVAEPATEVFPATDELVEFCDEAGLDVATEGEAVADIEFENDVGA